MFTIRQCGKYYLTSCPPALEDNIGIDPFNKRQSQTLHPFRGYIGQK
jgi:hypothetical protein